MKAFPRLYAGCFGSDNNIKYITDSELAGYVKTKYESPFLNGAAVTDVKVGTAILKYLAGIESLPTA